MLAGSGHIAGVVNPPRNKKYQHWLNETAKNPPTLDEWQAGAKEYPGSWWHDWDKWLSAKSGPKVPARVPGEGGLPAIEDAPGQLREGALRRVNALPPPHEAGVACSGSASSWTACPRHSAGYGGRVMKFPRRTFMQLAVGAAALPAMPGICMAQAYPSRPVRIVVGFPAGGATDIQARLMGEWLTERLGQQFIVENKPGASGNIGTEMVAKAPADGYTLLQVVTPHAINAALYSNLSFDFMRDIAPVICSARLAYVVVVNPSVPATTLPEFIAYAKANPGKINYGSAGQGTPQNIACELFKMMTGVNLVHVPYRGGAPAVADLISGHVQVIFAPLSESIQQIKAGKLRPLAVTTATRLDVLPDVPSVADFVPGYEASGFAGIGAPKEHPGRDHRYAEQGAQCRPRR